MNGIKQKLKVISRSIVLALRVLRVFFADQFAVVEQDRIEKWEHRWQTLGLADGYLLLMVAHTVRDDEDGTEVIRIISARRAKPKERKRYEQNCTL